MNIDDVAKVKIDIERIYIPNLGIKAKDETMGNRGWFNFGGVTQEQKEQMKATLESLVKAFESDDIEIELVLNENGKYIDLGGASYKPKSFKPRGQAKHDDREDVVSMEELLNDAHKKGVVSMKSECIFVDYEKKMASFRATITMKDGKIFEAHGDASPENCGKMIAQHWYRMAESRAYSRALRFATNTATVSEEEVNGKEVEKHDGA